MERNTTRRIYDEFFIPKQKPDLRRPTHCKKISVVDELTQVADHYLSHAEVSKLKSLISRLDKAVYEEMEKKDNALLREIQGQMTVRDKQIKRMEEFILPSNRVIMQPIQNEPPRYTPPWS